MGRPCRFASRRGFLTMESGDLKSVSLAIGLYAPCTYSEGVDPIDQKHGKEQEQSHTSQKLTESHRAARQFITTYRFPCSFKVYIKCMVGNVVSLCPLFPHLQGHSP